MQEHNMPETTHNGNRALAFATHYDLFLEQFWLQININEETTVCVISFNNHAGGVWTIFMEYSHKCFLHFAAKRNIPWTIGLFFEFFSPFNRSASNLEKWVKSLFSFIYFHWHWNQLRLNNKQSILQRGWLSLTRKMSSSNNV